MNTQEENKMPEITITITGDVRSSKTNLAALISEMLNNNRISSIMVNQDADIMKRIVDLKNEVTREEILNAVKKCRITIIDYNGNPIDELDKNLLNEATVFFTNLDEDVIRNIEE